MVTVGQQCNFMGCYIAPYYASTIEDVIAAIGKRPRRAEMLVFGNFNVGLEDPEVTARD